MNRLRSYIVSAFLLFLLLPGGYAIYLLETGNFHEITPGEAYRSAQPDGDKLEYYIKQYHIKSVLNLRGQNKGSAWYKVEVAACSRYGIAHYDLALTSTQAPSAEAVKNMNVILTTAPRPILIHCQFGADRSGLVAAMWKVIVDKVPKSEAKKQLSFLYGHFPIRGKDAMDRFFEKWNPTDQYSN